MKKIIIVGVVFVSVLFFALGTGVFANSISSSVSNPEKLFSIGIGTSTTTDSGSNVGIFLDDRAEPTYNTFYFPPSFAIGKDSNTLVVLDSIRNRLAFFSLAGQYEGEVILPFNLPAKDFAWFPKTDTMIFIFQNSPDIGILNISISNFSVKSSSAFVVPEASSTKNAITNIWPIDVATSSLTNYFVLNTQGESSGLIFAQASSSVAKLSNTDGIIGMIGLQNKNGVVGYANDNSPTIIVKDFATNQISKINISTSTSGILSSVDGNNLASVQLIGADKDGNLYVEAIYPSSTIEISSTAVVYEIDQNGFVLNGTKIFSSPQMLSNRYVFVDQYGSIFYMRADDKNTIGIYEYVTDKTSVALTNNTNNSLALVCPYILFVQNYSWVLPSILAFILILIIFIGSITSGIIMPRYLGSMVFFKILFFVLVGLLVFIFLSMLKCGTLITFDNLPTPLANTTTYASIPTNYEGLSWSGFFISNATPKSGYEAGIISLPNVAYNSDGGVATIQSLRAGKTFNLISAHMAAAWSDGLQVDIAGYLGSTKIYDNKYTLSATESKFINFNYQGVDKIVFSSSGGTPHQAYGDTGQSYKNFLMDNVLVGF